MSKVKWYFIGSLGIIYVSFLVFGWGMICGLPYDSNYLKITGGCVVFWLIFFRLYGK